MNEGTAKTILMHHLIVGDINRQAAATHRISECKRCGQEIPDDVDHCVNLSCKKATAGLSSEQFAQAVNWFASPDRQPAAIEFERGPMQDMAVAFEAANCIE